MEIVIAILVLGLLAFAVAKVVYVAVLLGVMLTSAVFGWVVLPALWLAGSIVLLPARVALMLVSPAARAPATPAAPELAAAAGVRCDFARCRCVNPAEARYCRRCGRSLAESERLAGPRRPPCNRFAPAYATYA